MAYYAFINPVITGKMDLWKSYIQEMTGPRNQERKESRKKVTLSLSSFISIR